MLFEMINGDVPFAADTQLKVLAMHRTVEVPPLDPGLGVPAAVESPADRYASAAEYAVAVDDCLRRYARPAA